MQVADIVFWAFNVLCSVYSIWRLLALMAMSGEVDWTGRLALLMALVPILSVIFAIAILIAEALFYYDSWWDKFWNSKEMVKRRIAWKIRKRWKGPLVRLVEHMHNKRKEKENETDVPEV